MPLAKKFWISCTGSKVPFWQNWKIAKMALLNLCMKFKIFFWPKVFFWSIMKMATRKFFHNLSKGPPNPGFMQENVQKGDYLKKDSQELKKNSCFRFLWISRRPGTLNWERVVFLPSKSPYRKCVLHIRMSRFFVVGISAFTIELVFTFTFSETAVKIINSNNSISGRSNFNYVSAIKQRFLPTFYRKLYFLGK